MKISFILFFAFAFIALSSCSNSDSAGTSANFSALIDSAVKIAPQVSTTFQRQPVKTYVGKSRWDGSVDSTLLSELITPFLIFACHTSDGSTNFCSKYGITVTDFTDPTYQLNVGNFMGQVNGLAMKYSDVYSYMEVIPNCGRASATAKSPTITGGDLSYLFGMARGTGFFDALNCVGQSDFGSGDAPYVAYSNSTTSNVFLSFQRETAGQGSYVYQGYVRRAADGSPVIMAYNSPVYNSDTFKVRISFIGNMVTNRIVLKNISSSSRGASTVSLIGTAGITTTGLVNGYYGMRATQTARATATVCVDNGLGQLTAGSHCDSDETIVNWFSGASTWADVKEYLGMTDADDTILSGWQAKLATGDTDLDAGDTPNAATDIPSAMN